MIKAPWWVYTAMISFVSTFIVQLNYIGTDGSDWLRKAFINFLSGQYRHKMEINVTGMCCIWLSYKAGRGALIQIQVKYPSSIVHLKWRLSCCHGYAEIESLETECATSPWRAGNFFVRQLLCSFCSDGMKMSELSSNLWVSKSCCLCAVSLSNWRGVCFPVCFVSSFLWLMLS